jgi:lipopolysaccharide transport system ATP-binding protein
MKPVIEVNKLSKSYDISHRLKPSYGSLRDDITSKLQRLLLLKKSDSTERFWALKNVSFSVNQGEIVGIIGKNGSGKSTLLKILSRIVDPTQGQATLRGNLASLLEVGTGFHPELTGRENIYLNGSILGMNKKEIARKFDDIIEFAEVEKFLDTPVKFYSSGMYVRLAFAVAAHLEPDILIVDEVLSVGDAQFQKKSLGKMENVAKEGRTVIFVSHSMPTIQQLCSRVIYLDKGRIASSGTPRSIIKEYLVSQNLGATSTRWINKGKLKNDIFVPKQITVVDEKGKRLDSSFNNNQRAWIKIEAEVLKTPDAFTIGYALYSDDGMLLYWSYPTDILSAEEAKLKPGQRTLMGEIPSHLLNQGNYRLELIGGIHNKKWLFQPGVDSPFVSFGIDENWSKSPYWTATRPGALAPRIDWKIQ